MQTNRTIPSAINSLFVEECEERSRDENNGRNGDEKIRHGSSIHLGNDLPFTLLIQHNRNPKQEAENERSRNPKEAKKQRAQRDGDHPIDGVTNTTRR